MKLTKSRQAATIFYIFFSIVFVVLGFWQINRGKEKTEIIEEVTGKSESYIRKCSDPDLDQQLDHRDAIKIDKACVERGLSPYLLRSHEYIILKELKKTKLEDQSMNELLVQFTISLGKLLDSIK